MKISSSQLIGLAVVTKAGQELGKVKSIIIDIDSQSILEYEIKPSNPVKKLISGDFFVARGQVLEITSDKLIVEDNFSSTFSLRKADKIIKEKKESVAINKD